MHGCPRRLGGQQKNTIPTDLIMRSKTVPGCPCACCVVCQCLAATVQTRDYPYLAHKGASCLSMSEGNGSSDAAHETQRTRGNLGALRMTRTRAPTDRWRRTCPASDRRQPAVKCDKPGVPPRKVHKMFVLLLWPV